MLGKTIFGGKSLITVTDIDHQYFTIVLLGCTSDEFVDKFSETNKSMTHEEQILLLLTQVDKESKTGTFLKKRVFI